MGPSGPRFKLIYHYDMFYEGWIDSKFIFVHKGVFDNYVRLHRG